MDVVCCIVVVDVIDFVSVDIEITDVSSIIVVDFDDFVVRTVVVFVFAFLVLGFPIGFNS